jgi:hypothetical protein
MGNLKEKKMKERRKIRKVKEKFKLKGDVSEKKGKK